MRRKGRTRKEQKIASKAAYDSMESNVSGEAARRFIHKAYTSYDVAGYMAKKYNIKEEVKP